MDLSTANARIIYTLPPDFLRTHLPRIFNRLRVPERNEEWVDAYVNELYYTIQRISRARGSSSGWDPLMAACVEAGVVEACLSFAHHAPRGFKNCVFNALDIVNELCIVANRTQRKALAQRAAACDARQVCLDVMRNGEFIIHRYGAVRAFRALCTETCLGHTMTPDVMGDTIAVLLRFVLDNVESFSDQLRDTETLWQARRLTDRVLHTPENAAKYGMRWFALTQELALWAVQTLVCLDPPLTRQYRLEVLRSHPQIIDLLLDCALVPRSAWYPDSVVDQTALDTLMLLLQLPLYCVPGLDAPLEGSVREELGTDWQSAMEGLRILVSRPSWLSKILAIWNRIDGEEYPQLARMLGRTRVEWFGLPVEPQKLLSMFENRGHIRIHLLYIVTCITYLPDIPDATLVSLLRIAYLGTKNGRWPDANLDDMPLPTPRELHEHMEWIAGLFRTPMCISDEDYGAGVDAQSQIPAAVISAPIALLRLLTVLARRGTLDACAAWTALPDGAAPDTDLGQVQQIASAPVVRKTLGLALKRVAAMREKAKKHVANAPFRARFDYRTTAELAAAVVALDDATQGRWRSKVRGVRKELVLCLGNAAEMSNRLRDYKAALSFALAAEHVCRNMPEGEEPIPEDTLSKNARRLERARSNIN